MPNLFHKMFGEAHCPHCEHDKECKSCESLRQLLTEERFTNRRLLDRIIELTTQKPIEERIEAPATELKPIAKGHTPWRVRAAALEEEARAEARVLNEMKQNKQSTEDLEKELLGVEHAREVS